MLNPHGSINAFLLNKWFTTSSTCLVRFVHGGLVAENVIAPSLSLNAITGRLRLHDRMNSKICGKKYALLEPLGEFDIFALEYSFDDVENVACFGKSTVFRRAKARSFETPNPTVPFFQRSLQKRTLKYHQLFNRSRKSGDIT